MEEKKRNEMTDEALDTVTGGAGQSVTFSQTYCKCPGCGQWSPLFEIGALDGICPWCRKPVDVNTAEKKEVTTEHKQFGRIGHY